MMKRVKAGLKGKQRGSIIVFMALAVWGIMMFVAFAVDFGNYYSHRSGLQHAADAAALAGIAKYAEAMDTHGAARLVELPTVISKDDVSAFDVNVGQDTYTFTQLGVVPTAIHEFANQFIEKNAMDNVEGILTDSIWTWSTKSDPVVTSTNGTKITTTTTEEKCSYMVEISQPVDTFFARLFGVKTLPVKVSAMAMLSGQDAEVVEELLPTISGNLNDIIPNYYWETIVQHQGTVTDTEHIDPKTGLMVKDATYTTKLYKANNIYYLTSDMQVDEAGSYKGWPEFFSDDTEGHIIGFEDSTDGICAKPIHADPSTDESILKEYVKTLYYKIDKDFIQYNGKDIIGLFLDRDNVANRGKNWEGATQRFTQIDIDDIRGNNPNIPLFMRIESEPIQIGANGLTVVHGIEIRITGKQEKPVVLAYDGPDPNRVQTDAPSLPIVPTQYRAWTEENVDISKTNQWVQKGSYHKKVHTFNDKPVETGRIMDKAEPLKQRYVPEGEDLLTYDTSFTDRDLPETMVLTTTTTPAPVYIYLPSDKTFNGAIFMPRSKIVIIGGGKINGFIAARQIEQRNPGNDRVFIQSQEISMPTLGAYRKNANNISETTFNYTKYYVTDKYNLVYTNFVDYTDSKYIPSDIKG